MSADMTAEERLDRAVREAIEAAPPLTDEQRETVAHVLRTSGATTRSNAA